MLRAPVEGTLTFKGILVLKLLLLLHITYADICYVIILPSKKSILLFRFISVVLQFYLQRVVDHRFPLIIFQK